MPDYDPKSIPILDDVIKTEESDNTDIDDQEGTPALFETTPVEEESHLDLFAAQPVDASANPLLSEDVPGESTRGEDNEPQLGIIDDIIADDNSNDIDITAAEDSLVENSMYLSANDDAAENDEIESALISYDADSEDSETVADIEAVDIAAVDVKTQTAELPESHASLKSMVDDITKELMPDLEQQLRYLIQQALEDRLPDELIGKLIDKKENTIK